MNEVNETRSGSPLERVVPVAAVEGLMRRMAEIEYYGDGASSTLVGSWAAQLDSAIKDAQLAMIVSGETESPSRLASPVPVAQSLSQWLCEFEAEIRRMKIQAGSWGYALMQAAGTMDKHARRLRTIIGESKGSNSTSQG